MSLIDPDAVHVAEFPEECWKSAAGCNWRVRAAFIQNSQMWEIRKFVGPHTCTSTRMTEDHRKLDSKLSARFQYRVSYRKAWIAKQMVMEQLYGDFDASYNELQGWIAAMREYIPGTKYIHDALKRFELRRPLVVDSVYHLGPMELISGIDKYDCRRFQTLHYPCAHVVAAYAKVNLNVEQFVDDVYILNHTLRVWKNEFPVLPELSAWEMPPMTFELVPDRGLRRNPRSRPQSTRIRNEMDIREKSDGTHCGLCRLAGHNRSKCPQ
ncbi:hypothetical protein GOBAR_AA35197 [Gossypium barbadense]|uniref:SWIM-type domain-containing protein n=1 Tax=Gossypium barbadense TaxID=3634 RepID=A0A2P5W368_GOSBA|nr:hypothetical protein GOBAR_AA35197 [Gossypium barbadense]